MKNNPAENPVPHDEAPTADKLLKESPVLGRLLALCWRQRRMCVQVILCQLILLSVGLAGLNFTGLGIDYLRSIVDPGTAAPHWPLDWKPGSSWSPMSVLFLLAGAIVAAALLRGWLTWLGGVILARLVHRSVVAGLQNAVFEKLQSLHLSFYDQQTRGAIINRATGDIQAVRTFVDTVLIQVLVTVISLAVYVAYMVSIHAVLSLACLATVPVMWILCTIFSRAVYPLYQRNRDLFDRMILTLAECVEGVNVVKGFGRESEMRSRFQGHNQAVKEQQNKIFSQVSFFTPSIDMLTQVNLVVLLLYGGWLVMHGELALGTGMVVFAGLLQQFSNQVITIAQIANGVQESLAGARRVFEILDAPLGLELAEKPVDLPRGGGAVEFRNVSFSYVPGNPVLRDISFKVRPGECIALVGETGSGKSALLNLIPRFYDATSGNVSIDGHDVKEVEISNLRKHVRMVFQESFLFSDTVAANICFGQHDAPRERMIAAARTAQAHDFIEALPQGYDTILGESGVDLSGGQRQRLAIARALLSDPSILLLDDPTAAIDPETEHEILSAIERASLGRTTFIVAHRLSTLRRADRILVLERGTIVQVGTHDELISEPGAYQHAAMHQMVDDESRRLLAEEIEPEYDEVLVDALEEGRL